MAKRIAKEVLKGYRRASVAWLRFNSGKQGEKVRGWLRPQTPHGYAAMGLGDGYAPKDGAPDAGAGG